MNLIKLLNNIKLFSQSIELINNQSIKFVIDNQKIKIKVQFFMICDKFFREKIFFCFRKNFQNFFVYRNQMIDYHHRRRHYSYIDAGGGDKIFFFFFWFKVSLVENEETNQGDK